MKLLRIKADSGLKAENVFLVESKWPTQRLILQGKYPVRLVMITDRHAKWMLGFARQHGITLIPPNQLSIENMNINDGSTVTTAEIATSSATTGRSLKVFLVSQEVMEGILLTNR